MFNRSSVINKTISLKMQMAINWLLNSKIHNTNECNAETYGSFNNYFNLITRKCNYAYTEITAYGIELLLDLYSHTYNNNYLMSAELAGNWLLTMQCLCNDIKFNGSFLSNYKLPNGPRSNVVYSFDTAICIEALVDLYKITQMKKYLDAAKKAMKWLLTLQRSNGSFSSYRSMYNSTFHKQGKSIILSKKRAEWFKQSGCHHGKIAIGLMKFHSVLKDTDILKSVEKLCEWTLSQQKDDGRFLAISNGDSTFSHTHCYALEGLIWANLVLSSEEISKAVLKGSKFLICNQLPDGSIPDWFPQRCFPKSVDISAVAQAIRIWLLCLKETENNCYYHASQKAANYLMKVINTSGGFHLLEFNFKFFTLRYPKLYSWPTIFTIHALHLLKDVENVGRHSLPIW